MTSGPLAVRDDLFGFVQALLTPRQGVDDNTNPKPPQQQPENAAPGPQSTTGGTGPGGAAPAGAAMNAPLPSGTRVVPEGSVGPALSPVTAQDASFLTESAAYKMWRAQQDQLRLQAQENYGWDTAMSGLAGLASGLSGGLYAAGQAGFGNAARPGTTGATGSDAMTLEQHREFEADATKSRAAAAAKAAAYAFAQAHGIPKADIDAMVVAGDYSKLRELGFNITDPKAAGEGQLKTLEAKKATEFDAVMRDPALVGRLMQATGTDDPAVLRTLYLAGKLDTVLEKAAQGGPDYAEYMKAYPGGVDAKTGKPFTYADYLMRKQESASPTGGLNKTLAEGLGKFTIEKINAGQISAQSIPNMIQNYDFLRNNQAAVGGILGTDAVQSAMRFIQGMNIPGLDMKGLDINQQLKQGTTSILLTHAKALGANPTDRDAKIIEDYANGKHTNSQAAMLAMQRTIIRGEILKQIAANKAIDSRIAGGLPEGLQAQLEQARVAIPDYTGIVFHPEHAADLEQALAAGKNPAVLQAKTDALYGPGMWDYYVANKHPELRGEIAVATKKPEDDFEFTDLTAKEKAVAEGPRDPDKLSYEATTGGAIANLFSLGHADDIISFLTRMGLASKDAPKQKTSEAIAENPKSAALGTALGLALPVAGVESLIGNAARAGAAGVPAALGGEGAVAAGGRAALAELGVGGAAEAGKAATGGTNQDWTAPLYNAAFAGPLAAFGNVASRAFRGPEAQAGRTIRKTVGEIPEGTPLPSTRVDPTKTIPDVAQTAPEALQQAGLGAQAADAESLLRRTLGGAEPVVPGRNAALDAGSDALSAATSRMPKGAPAYNAMDKQGLFEMFRSGFEGVQPTPPTPVSPRAEGMARSGGRILTDELLGKIPGGSTLSSMFNLDSIGGEFAVGALHKVMGSLPDTVPKNADTIRAILMNPEQFAGILKPDEIAALSKLAVPRAGAASFAGQGLSGEQDAQSVERQKYLRREFGR